SAAEKQPSCRHYSLDELKDIHLAEAILNKYKDTKDALRWALKPVFLTYLLQQYEKVIYLDNDLFFFSPFEFLSEELNDSSFLLTPHWSPFSPLPHTSDFEMNFRLGLYNAGFVGVSRQGMPGLGWWAEACLFKMAADFSNGYYDDQRYLDLLPVIDEKARILRHQGCNVGGWNIHQNKRIVMNGTVYINGRYPVVFIHFNQSTLEQIALGNDKQLQPFLDIYKASFASFGYSFEQLKKNAAGLSTSPLLRLKRKVRIRTRLKLLIFQLYQKF
ncbi:MAG TPA: hypothetical protein VER36_10960, partial [Flavisolibacter sp.]|nr:hypothetical protein [Flavisolibacter sp.]